jgi:hypothetical protein
VVDGVVDEAVGEAASETSVAPATATTAATADPVSGGDPLPGVASDQPSTSDLPATEPVTEMQADEPLDDPVWAMTGAVVGTAGATGDLPATEPITEVWTGPVDAGPVTRAAPATTGPGAVPTAVAPTVPIAAAPPPRPTRPVPDHRFRYTVMTLLGAVGGVLVLVGMFATVVEVTSSTPLLIGDDAPVAFRTGIWAADDLGDNLSIAGLIAALCMVLGGVAAAFGWRWGSGLAGGGGLAVAGLAALVVGLAQYPIDAAHEFAAIPSEQQFTLTITRDLGYWLLIVAGVIGIVAFFASTNDAFADHRSGLNPWIAALGALAVVVTAAGTLIPAGTAVFSDNWYVIERPGEPPAMLVAMRLVQLGLFALGGVIGFLSVRRWGLGVAAGVSLPLIWLGVSTLFEIGTNPVGPAFRNPGAASTDLHGVTIIGLSAVFAMLVLGAAAAYDQSARER